MADNAVRLGFSVPEGTTSVVLAVSGDGDFRIDWYLDGSTDPAGGSDAEILGDLANIGGDKLVATRVERDVALADAEEAKDLLRAKDDPDFAAKADEFLDRVAEAPPTREG